MAGWALAAFLAFEVLASRSYPAVSGLAEAVAAAVAAAWLVARARSGGSPLRGAVTVLALLAAAEALSGSPTTGAFRHILLLGLACAAGASLGPGYVERVLALLGGLLGVASLVRHLIAPSLDGRWASPLESPSLLACALCLTIPATLGLVWTATTARFRAPLLALAALQLVALVGSGSRLALGAVVVACAVWAVGRASDRRARLAGAVATGMVAVAVGLAALAPARGHESSASHRVFIWQTAWNVVSARPLTGVGVGEFASAFRRSRPWIGTGRSEALAVVRDAHCDFLHLAAASGVPAALAFAWLVAAGCVGRRQASAPHPTLSQRGRARASASHPALRIALLAWLLNGLGNGSLDVLAVGMLAWAAIGAVAAEPGQPSARAAVSRARAVAAAVAALVALAVWLAPEVAGIRVRAAAGTVPLGAVVLTPELERALAACDDLDAWLGLEHELATGADRVRLLRALVARRPLEPEPRARLATALGPDSPEALGECARAVALDPYNPFYRRMLGDCLERAGRPSEARAQFGLALPLFERTLEVAAARNGDDSPAAEAVRAELARVRSRLDTPSGGVTIRRSPASRGEDESQLGKARQGGPPASP